MKFVLSRQAERALEELWDYYFQQSGSRLADRILGEIHDAIRRLIELPQLGHYRPDLTDKPFRFYRVYNILLHLRSRIVTAVCRAHLPRSPGREEPDGG